MSRDDREYHETVNGAHAALLSYARRYADFGLAPEADLLGSQEPYPPSLRGTPIVIDTDIGGDPDDAVALAVAARQVPQLVPVVTSDEHEGQRSIPPLATRRLWPRT